MLFLAKKRLLPGRAVTEEMLYLILRNMRQNRILKELCDMKKIKILPYILGLICALAVAGISFYLFCPAINIHNPGLWALVIVGVLIFIVVVIH